MVNESVVLRLLECYAARGTIVKKSIWSCSLGWACDPIRSGSTARRVGGKLSLIGGSNMIGLSRIRRIGERPILERQAGLDVKVSVGRVSDRNHAAGGRSGDRGRYRAGKD